MEKNDLIKRFESKLTKTDGCWIWNAYKSHLGYGLFYFKGKNTQAHRASYCLYKEDFIDGLVVCHKCDNPSCVNPDHLFVGTHKDNSQDCVKKGRTRKPQRYYLEKMFGKERVDKLYKRRMYEKYY